MKSQQLNQGEPVPVSTIVSHDSADIAVVRVERAPRYRLSPFYMLSSSHGFGVEVGAWGYTAEALPEGGAVPTPRAYHGTIQRVFQYTSKLGYSYSAGELSFPAPRGLSGGPVFKLPQGLHLAGIVTESFESTMSRHSTEEFDEAGVVTRERIHRVIEFGLFVDLRPLSRWLDQQVGPELG